MIVGKKFKITDAQAIARDDNFAPKKDAAGNLVLIPQNSLAEVEAWHTFVNASGNETVDYIKVKQWGWTVRTNFEDGLQNEVLEEVLPDFISTDRKHKTVTDPYALVRIKKGFKFEPDGNNIIPQGTLLLIKRKALFQNYYKAAWTLKQGNQYVEDETKEPIWTFGDNLSDGWFDIYGVSSIWDDGKYIGREVLFSVIGTGGEVEYIVKDYYDKFVSLIAAAEKEGVEIYLTSGFRTWRKQKKLYDLFLAGIGAPAAKPGFSNHQQGTAFDVNTGGFDTEVYNWLKKNGPQYGFIRTVNNEHWHWEYRPADAQKYGYKMPNVTN